MGGDRIRGKKVISRCERAVSHIVGFVLVISIATILMTTTIFTFNVLVERKNKEAGEKIALDLANRIADSVVDAVTVIRNLRDTNYTKVIDLPESLGGKDYYIELTKDKVYVNTTDGFISVSSTLYSSAKLGINLYGKVYASAGQVYVRCNKTSSTYKIDFGTPSSYDLGKSSTPTMDYSPTEQGYFRVSNLTKISLDKEEWIKWNISGEHTTRTFPFPYLIPVLVDHSAPPDRNESSSPTDPDYQILYNFTVKVKIPPWFPYHLVKKTDAGEPKIAFWEPNISGSSGDSPDNIVDEDEIRPYYVERWIDEPPGTSVVWVRLADIPVGKEIIYLCFGGDVSDATFSIIVPRSKRTPKAVFELFEDFDIGNFDPQLPDEEDGFVEILESPTINCPSTKNFTFYKLYTEWKNLTYVRAEFHSELLFGRIVNSGAGENLLLKDVMIPPDAPSTPQKGNFTASYAVYVLEAKVRYSDIRAIDGGVDGDILLNKQAGGNPERIGIGGFFSGTMITLADGTLKDIKDFSGQEEIKTVFLEESIGTSIVENTSAEKITYYPFPEGVEVTTTTGRSVMCSSFQHFCVISEETRPKWRWVPACELREGDEVVVLDGDDLSIEKIRSVESRPNAGSRHLITPTGNFFANGFLVQSYYRSYIIFTGGKTPTGTEKYTLSGFTHPPEPSPPTELCIFKNDSAEMGTNYSYQVESQPNIEDDRWYMLHTLIINAKVSDWRDENLTEPYDWSFVVIRSILYEDTIGGIVATFTPYCIDTSAEISNISDPPGSPYLGGNIGLGCGLIATSLLGFEGESSAYIDIDWVRIRKSCMHPPYVIVMAPKTYYIGWWNTSGITANYTIEPNALLGDYNEGSENRTFGVLITRGGNYTVTLIMGDNNRSHHGIYAYYQIDNGNLTEVVSDLNIGAGDFERVVFTVDIPEDGKDHVINITFSTYPLDQNGNQQGNPSGSTWVINAIEIERGFKGVWIE